MERVTVKSKRYDELMANLAYVKKEKKREAIPIDNDIDKAFVNLASAIVESAREEYVRSTRYIYKKYGELPSNCKYKLSNIMDPIPNLPKRNELVLKTYFQLGLVNQQALNRIHSMDSCIHFFKSDWCYMLSGINDPEYLINELNELAMKED